MDTFIDEIGEYPSGTIIIVKWKNKLEVKGIIDTVYDTNNGLDDDEDGYKEFYACLLEVIEIVKESAIYSDMDTEDLIYVSMKNPPREMKTGYANIKVGDFIDISIENTPVEVKLENGTIIWSKDI